MRLFFIFCFLLFAGSGVAQDPAEALKSVNSAYDEQGPALSPDGQVLYFTVSNHPANAGGVKDPGDIWYSRKEGAGWTAPQHAGTLINDRSYNAVAGFSPDGNQLFLHGHYGQGGAPARTQGIAVSRQRGDGWSRPENLSIPYFMNKSNALCGSLSDDNAVFVFSAESYGTHGVDDIYVSIQENGSWTEPKNLGRSINTQFQELSPSLSPDHKTLFFSSNGLKGYGSFDVYAAKRLDDTWRNWSTPENLGPKVNTQGRELFYRLYPDMGYALFTTTTSSDGYGDLRMHAPDEPLPAQDPAIFASLDGQRPVEGSTVSDVSEPVTEEPSPAAVPEVAVKKAGEVNVHGKVRNAKNGEIVDARVSFESPAGASETAQTGTSGFQIAVAPARYKVRIEANGFVSSLENLDLGQTEMTELEINFNLQPVEVGTTVNLKNVLFAQAKTDILPESYPELDLVVSFMKSNPRVRIELMGHTDGRGVHADNVRLSQQRVNKVKAYLVSRGIEARRITGRGFGGSKPVASNDTEESRRMNRRVEFVIRKF